MDQSQSTQNAKAQQHVASKELRSYPLRLKDFPPGKRVDFYLPLFETATAVSVNVPFIIARGAKPGPTLGICAAVHGNELNGIQIIRALLSDLNLNELSGTVICVPVVNVAAFNLGQRNFIDGVDLNNVFPGKKEGKPSEQFAYIFSRTFLPPLEYLIDIHTASDGRLNTMYVRADLESKIAKEMAMNVNPQIVLHGKGGDGTLRGNAMKLGIPAITIEAGNPNVVQGRMVFEGEVGIRNVMVTLGMLKGHNTINRHPVICKSSRWLRTTNGGFLYPRFGLGDMITKGQVIAQLFDLFGTVTHEYKAPEDGIVIGMAANPVALPGTRFCHLGKVKK